MVTRDNPATESEEQALVIERVFDAPRQLVWKAWTEPDRCVRWWGPKGFTTPVCKIDFRVGGVWLNCMRSPEGQDFWSTGVYREIVEPERIVTTDSFADAEGNPVPASHYGMTGDWPLEALITVTFEEHGRQDQAHPAARRHPRGRGPRWRPAGLERVLRQARRGTDQIVGRTRGREE